jgi:selenide,water dikinase
LVPILDQSIYDYINEGCVSGGSQRNWESIKKHVSKITQEQQALLCDPQTSGGLLIAVAPESLVTAKAILTEAGCYYESIGCLKAPNSCETSTAQQYSIEVLP